HPPGPPDRKGSVFAGRERTSPAAEDVGSGVVSPEPDTRTARDGRANALVDVTSAPNRTTRTYGGVSDRRLESSGDGGGRGTGQRPAWKSPRTGRPTCPITRARKL